MAMQLCRCKNATACTGPYSPHKTSYVQQQQTLIRDHFAVAIRRSSRKTALLLEREKNGENILKLLSKDEAGLKSVNIDNKGKGVIVTRPFNKGELICEYSGELVTQTEANKREELYSEDASIGCYMYYFQYENRKLCVDATIDNGRHGRLVNHSKKSSNVIVKVIPIDGQPFLCLFARKYIKTGEELQYDYGERDRDIIATYPWLIT